MVSFVLSPFLVIEDVWIGWKRFWNGDSTWLKKDSRLSSSVLSVFEDTLSLLF